jgi:hypothetical protein
MPESPQTHKPRWFRFWLIQAGLVILTMGGFVLLLFLSLSPIGDDPCGNDNVAVVLSPNKELKAVTFRRNCGATTAYSTHVSILPVNTELRNEAGNVLSIDHEPPLAVRWIDDHHLRISGAGAARAGSQLTRFQGIEITYD